MDNKKTGMFISQRRKEMSLTQKELAEKLNVTDKAVSKWETGNGAPDIYYNCTAKNWWFDFFNYNYNLKAELSGEPGSWQFESETISFSSNNFKSTPFIIHVEYDKSTVNVTVPSLKELIMMSRFSAYDSNDEYDDRANLYMEDFNDVKIVII